MEETFVLFAGQTCELQGSAFSCESQLNWGAFTSEQSNLSSLDFLRVLLIGISVIFNSHFSHLYPTFLAYSMEDGVAVLGTLKGFDDFQVAKYSAWHP